MNSENILEFVDWFIAQPDEQYDQRLYEEPCGTPACIAGHMEAFLSDGFDIAEHFGISREPALDGNLFYSEFHLLFHPDPFKYTSITGKLVSKEQAIACLRNIVEGMSVSEAWRDALGFDGLEING